ncbi:MULTISPECIES: hypothetical protein [Mycolicibacterium]|jgi:hypothetical protein|uniref:hypothetical protein n=1 Tax=Mycolicibacterium TaxID=1866885 RepID=UPI0006888A7F|nr:MULTISPECIES: hypothetical protein [Mycolicibacterium]UJL26838.1 hypothetical protein HZU38_17935 [Mycolicibacterium vanbaalenii]WND58959.1 hypothetical protein QQA43_11540 [Mycolicibacterium vanbaalenii]
MSETTTPENETTETPSEDGPQDDSQPGAGKSPGAEAAKYRVRAREAETALAAAQTRIEAMQRAEVERLASAGLSHPADLFSLSGNGLADYLGEDGNVDPIKVAADVEAILQERPGLKVRDLPVDTSQGHGSTPGRKAPHWGALLKD